MLNESATLRWIGVLVFFWLGGAWLSADELLVQELGCARCHSDLKLSSGLRDSLPNLSEVRHNPAWLLEYLQRPTKVRTNIGASRMPSFHLDIKEALALTLFLTKAGSRGTSENRTLESNLEQAKRTHPLVTAEMGKKIFEALNCAACHRHNEIQPREQSGPVLTGVIKRLSPEWLGAYLKKPHAIRPFGYHPGDGSRMPDFHLSEGEAARVTAWLFSLKSAEQTKSFAPRKLSEFSSGKAKVLMDNKYACMGCHQLSGKGGRIGPALDFAGERLQPAYLMGILNDPKSAAPHAIMPKPLLTQDSILLLANYLGAQKSNLSGTYPSLIDNQTQFPFAAKNSYQRYCGACHGQSGEGNGFNAQYLKQRPSVHADGALMQKRANDTLFDGIHSGGTILNKSHQMPAFGGTLSSKEISELVGHIRELCKCSEPAWAWDNKK